MQAHNCSSPLVERGLLGSWDLLLFLDEDERPAGHGHGRNRQFAPLGIARITVGNGNLYATVALHHGQELVEVEHFSLLGLCVLLARTCHYANKHSPLPSSLSLVGEWQSSVLVSVRSWRRHPQLRHQRHRVTCHPTGRRYTLPERPRAGTSRNHSCHPPSGCYMCEASTLG